MAVVDQKGREFLAGEREDRLQAYGHTPQDVNAHYSDEGQIQADYHKRFAFELIQNADDAMVDVDREKTVRFEVRDRVLLVANTGRPIDEDDVTALCTMSHTTKGLEKEQRASIGHKGRGFSSVLEITNRPQVYSTGISFEFDRDRSREPIRRVVEEDEDWTFDQIDGIPLMRLPFPPEEVPEGVDKLLAEDYNTVFRFPLKGDKVKADVVETISALDRNTVLFLRELERLEISVEGRREEGWEIEREAKEIDSEETDLMFVSVRHIGSNGARDDETRFALFAREGVEIGSHTGGIDANTWGDVKYTQLGLALRVDEREDGIHLTRLEEHPFFHVFLPTEEWCPIPVLVNGAFHTAISRTSINVTEDEDNYNGYLLAQVAELLATDVLAYVQGTATDMEEFIDCLDFTGVSPEDRERDVLKQRFISSIKSEFEDISFVPRLEKLQTGEVVSDPGYAPLSETVVPYYSSQQPEIAERIARLYGNDRFEVAGLDVSGWFPRTTLLTPNRAAILEGLGARKLDVWEVPAVLGGVPDESSPLEKYPEPEDALAADPVLQVLIWIWKTISGQDEIVGDFKEACKGSAVFPVGQPKGNVVRHVAKDETEFFLPPRRELPDIGLSGIQFLTPPVYRPEVPVETKRQSELVEEIKPALEAIWDVREFDFEEVVQAGVFPKLESPQNPGVDDTELRDIQVLDLIRGLAHRSVDADNPLPFIERTGGTLHRLCLLPVPTRDGGWTPAYRVYMSNDWQPESSDDRRVECVLEKTEIAEAEFLASPDELPGSVEYEPDDESAFDEWKRFFRWLGVSPHIRLTPFFDPKERRDLTGTIGIDRPERGSVLERLSEEDWSEYRDHLLKSLDSSGEKRREYDSIYRLNGIEYFNRFVTAASKDPEVAEALFKHITAWWDDEIRRYQQPELATHDVTSFRRRNQNCPKEREKRRVGLNLWLWQLKRASWCPSNRGMVKPEDVWLPTESVRQKFEILDVVLLPVLAEEVLGAASSARDLMHRLGVRHEVTRGNVQPSDAAMIVRTVAQMFRDEDDEVVARSLRQIKPAYRYLSELLPALDRSSGNIPDEDWLDARECLTGLDVLARQEIDEFVFERAQDTYFVRSPDVLERIPIEGIRVFVLQEDEAVRFGTYFGMRDLEGEAEADPRFIDDGEGDAKTEEVVAFLEEAAPFILCRLEAERPSQELIEQDINGMRSFIDNLTIVDDIEVEYKFGEGPDPTVIPSNPDFFLDRRGRSRTERPISFVKNADNNEEQNRLLARALCEYLEVSQFEGVITLLNADTDDRRLDYLKMAGAPASRDEVKGKRQDIFEGTRDQPEFSFEFDSDGETEGLEEGENDESAVERELRRRRERKTRDYPVYKTDELSIAGQSITVVEEPTNEGSGEGGGEREPGQREGVSVSQEYRRKVDKLGMSISVLFEHERLRDEYDCDDPGKYVFDVHNEDHIEDAQAHPIAGEVLAWLKDEAGLPLPFPGFDILTINPSTGRADRLIELKSSGHDLRTPSVTWNEWKTASTSKVQELYHLYIAGNLRKDIKAEPYLREIQNPFGVLSTETEEMVKKEVKVRVTDFKKDTHVRQTSLTVN